MDLNQNPEPPPPPPSPPSPPPPFEYLEPDTGVDKVAATLMDFTMEIPDRKGKGKVPDDAVVINLVSDEEEQEEQRERVVPVEIDFLSRFPVDHGQRFVNHGGEQLQPPPPQQLPPPRYYPHEVYREWEERVRLRRKQVFKETAKIHALRYARFEPPQDDGGGGSGSGSSVPQAKDGSSPSTPFSLAMEAIEGGLLKKIAWVSRKKPQDVRVSVPSLLELSMKTLADNADSIVSLGSAPDHLRHRLSQLLCDSRRINSRFSELLVRGSPTEIRIRNCSWLTEEEFTRCFQSCDLNYLEVCDCVVFFQLFDSCCLLVFFVILVQLVFICFLHGSVDFVLNVEFHVASEIGTLLTD
ncbi:uncharacterized protein LOC130713268 [Lotus japonicus]|uniref:uncharacterized protein LOC130713268 n=1 Tax=Lotus japonicus TaxID=34305 RepID=UPI002586BB96|nr:uncharacterized protein LOC130713268 [Lotus japonicus]